MHMICINLLCMDIFVNVICYAYIHDYIYILIIMWYLYNIVFGQVEVVSHKMPAFELKRWNLFDTWGKCHAESSSWKTEIVQQDRK